MEWALAVAPEGGSVARLGHRQRRRRARAGRRGPGPARDGPRPLRRRRWPWRAPTARAGRGGRVAAVGRLRRAWPGGASTSSWPTRPTCRRGDLAAAPPELRFEPARGAGRRADRPRGDRRASPRDAPGPPRAGRLGADRGGRRPGARAAGAAARRRASRAPATATTWPGVARVVGGTPGLSDAPAAAAGRPARRRRWRWSPPTRSTAWRRRSTCPRASTRCTPLKGRPRSQPCQVLLFAPALLDEALARARRRARARPRRRCCPARRRASSPTPTGRYAAAAGDAPGTVGLRAPRMSGPVPGLDMPLVATSANHPGGPDPARVDDVPGRPARPRARSIDAGPLPGTASAVVDLRAAGRTAGRRCWCARGPIPTRSRAPWPRSARRVVRPP